MTDTGPAPAPGPAPVDEPTPAFPSLAPEPGYGLPEPRYDAPPPPAQLAPADPPAQLDQPVPFGPQVVPSFQVAPDGRPVPPGPPPGPGVVPPFPVPPTEGHGGRLRMGMVLGGLALLLCCGGGGAALVGIGSVFTRAVNEQVDVVVGEYFTALQERRFDDAYGQLCADAKRSESAGEFNSRMGDEPGIVSYDIGTITASSAELAVPVELDYADGAVRDVQVALAQNTDTGRFEVCGVEE